MKKEVKEKKIKESKVQGNSLGAAGFTLGIISVVGISYIILNILMAVVGFVFCFIQQKNRPTKLGKAGLILNIIGFILNLLLIFLAPILTNWIQTLNPIS